MKSLQSLLRYKELFTNLYNILPEGDNKSHLKSIIDDIEQQLTNTRLYDGFIKLYCDFYDRLFIIMRKIAS
jgi:hypothetical protein